MAIALADLLDEKNVALQLRSRYQANALREIVQLLAANGKIDHPEKFLDAVLARERANPRVMEHGVAFPHARTDLVNRIVLGTGRSRAGVPFGKGQRARLIFVIGVPQRLINDYLICVGRWLGSSRRMSPERHCFTPKRRGNFWTHLRQGE